MRRNLVLSSQESVDSDADVHNQLKFYESGLAKAGSLVGKPGDGFKQEIIDLARFWRSPASSSSSNADVSHISDDIDGSHASMQIDSDSEVEERLIPEAFEQTVRDLSEGKPWIIDNTELVSRSLDDLKGWFEFACESLIKWQHSPCVHMVVSRVSLEVCWHVNRSSSFDVDDWTGFLPIGARRCARLLACGVPKFPFDDARLSHRRYEFFADKQDDVIPLMKKFSRGMKRDDWIILTGFFHSWLVFAVSSLVHELLTPEVSDIQTKKKGVVDAALWFISFMFLGPNNGEGSLSDSFTFLLMQYVNSILSEKKSSEELIEDMKATIPSSSSAKSDKAFLLLPSYLRSLCLTSLYLVKNPSPDQNSILSAISPAFSLYFTPPN